MSFSFETQELPTRKGARRVLVMTPEAEHVIDRWRLESLRTNPQRGRTDLEMLTYLRDMQEPVDVLVVRGRSERGSWRFADELEPSECEELGRRLLISQIPTWRKVIEQGVRLVAHSDYDQRELEAFNVARRSFIDDEAQDEADRDLLRRQVFFFGTPLERALERIAEALPLADLRRGEEPEPT